MIPSYQQKREELIPLIRDKALRISFGRADVEEIDTLNILRATMLAMERAVKVTVEFTCAYSN